MFGYKYIKDKNIRIFYEQKVQGLNGATLSIKHYIHPENTFLKAHVRQLSADERIAAQAIRDMSELEFVINSRDIRAGMFCEFQDKTYKIGAPDRFDFSDTEIKFRAAETSCVEYDDVEWEDWK